MPSFPNVSNSRTVSLHWRGKDAWRQRRVETSEPSVAWSTPDGQGVLYRGDNLPTLRFLGEKTPSKATLVYMDPPFLTNRVHGVRLRKTTAEGSRVSQPAFDDRWTDQAEFLESIGSRLEAARDLLAPDGCLVIHVDSKTSHYLRVLGDEIFGPDSFASEIIWRYRRWPTKTPNFQRVHDVLLRFRKDPKVPPRWTQLFEPLAASTVATWGVTKQRAEFAKDGRRVRSRSTDEKTQGVPLGDVWDIGVIAPISRERTGYPSQKPEALLERIMTALTLPGDLVVDPYAGSGTTLAVAARLGRRFIGIDESEVALSMASQRLERMVALPKAGGIT